MSISQNTRSLLFSNKNQDRYWWHKLPNCSQYIPPIYSGLTEEEWEIMEAWFIETDQLGITGEIAIPFMSMVHGLVMGNGISRIVQLGHCAGYSLLLIGFMLRRMGFKHGLFSIDIDPDISKFSQKWVGRAGLTDYVSVQMGDSADPAFCSQSGQYFNNHPQLILIDSSHQYDHTIKELDLWFTYLQPAGCIVAHDSSNFAKKHDISKRGGVKQALDVWSKNNLEADFININADYLAEHISAEALTYKDGSGIGIIYKKSNKTLSKAHQDNQKESAFSDPKDEIIMTYLDLLLEKQKTIIAQTKLIDEKDDAVRAQTKLIDERDEAICSQTKLIDEKDEIIRAQTKLINERDKDIQQKDHIIQDLELRWKATFEYRIKNLFSKILKK